MGRESGEILMSLAKQFVDDYYNRNKEFSRLYRYKAVPMPEEVVQELESTGQLNRAIDQNTEHNEVCYLLLENGQYVVFTLYRDQLRLNEMKFTDLKKAAIEKFNRIISGVLSASK